MRTLNVLLAALVLTLAAAPIAAAHGFQKSSSPAPNSRLTVAPVEVRVEMSEPVEVARTRMSVLDTHGEDHAVGPVRAGDNQSRSQTLVQGVQLANDEVYTVAWSTLWLDGHRTEGGFAFVVGNASLEAHYAIPESPPLPAAAQVFFRALGYIGWIAAGGIGMYAGLVAAPAWRATRPPKSAAWPGSRRIAWIGFAAAATALLGAIGTLLEEAHAVGYGILHVADLVAQTQIGRVLFARFLAASALTVAGLVVLRRRTMSWLLAPIGAAGLFTLSWGSHAYSNGGILLLLVDLVHVAAASLWAGMLLGTLATLRKTLRSLPPNVRGIYLSGAVTRVSLVAFTSFLVLIATGTINAAIQLGSLPALWESTYGRILLVKLFFVGGLFCLGALNRLFFVPAYREAPFREPHGLHAPRVFTRVVATEVTLILIVLGVTGILGGTSPHEALAPGEGFVITRDGEHFRATLRLDPGALGTNEASVHIVPKGFTGDLHITNVTLYSQPPSSKLPPGQSTLTLDPSGDYKGNITLGLSGEWLLTLYVQRSDAFDDAAEFPVRIAG